MLTKSVVLAWYQASEEGGRMKNSKKLVILFDVQKVISLVGFTVIV
jgi:hypothetical protein